MVFQGRRTLSVPLPVCQCMVTSSSSLHTHSQEEKQGHNYTLLQISFDSAKFWHGPLLEEPEITTPFGVLPCKPHQCCPSSNNQPAIPESHLPYMGGATLLANTTIGYICSLMINVITFQCFVFPAWKRSLRICRHTAFIRFTESTMHVIYCTEQRGSCIRSEPQNQSAFTHSPLALMSALLSVQDLQSRFPILTRDQTRLIYAIVSSERKAEKPCTKSKHIPSASLQPDTEQKKTSKAAHRPVRKTDCLGWGREKWNQESGKQTDSAESRRTGRVMARSQS